MVEERDLPPRATYEANDHNCRYHPGNGENEKISLVSQGMCPIAYLHLYPTLFALHLNQKKSEIKISSEHQKQNQDLFPFLQLQEEQEDQSF